MTHKANKKARCLWTSTGNTDLLTNICIYVYNLTKQVIHKQIVVD